MNSDDEERILRHWEEGRIVEKVKEKNKGKKVFFFLEGPPYANGELHLGHIRGYSRKDTILRFKRLSGYDVFDRAGFDVHGLPIENKAERNLNIKSKRDIEAVFGVDKFISECINLYKGNVKGQIEVAKRYGVWMDFDDAYIPASAEYIGKAWEVFKKIYDKNLVYKDTRVMPYCMHCGTALAKGPEVEEEEDTDPSIYFLFRIDVKSKSKIELPQGAYLLVWTTTPWTLPANMSVAVNPTARYVLADLDGRNVILAKERIDDVGKAVGSSLIIKSEFYGSELEGIKYTSPLEPNIDAQKETRKFHKVLLSEEFVTLTEGTGILHVAPAYGPEDYELAKKNRIPMLSIVGLDGSYSGIAGKYAGLKVIHEANRAVEADMKDANALLLKTSIRHKYPHCWRCKEKLVYLPTEQWFINISKIKKMIKRESEKVSWHPNELKEWFLASIDQAPDWVITRQRYWGIPIPIWICAECGNVRAIGSFNELKEASGADIKPSSEMLHKPEIDKVHLKCGKCLGDMKRIPDVFDVWYDSGVAHTSSLSDAEFKRMYGGAFITEGPDQIRGWFATLMKTGVAAYGKTPFNKILMQGWVLDSKGEAMHKSKGNYISGSELIGKVPIDAVRGFMISHLPHENLKFSHKEIEEMQQNITMLTNIANLLNEYSSAIGYKPDKAKKPRAGMEFEDAWISSRFNSALNKATISMDNYEPDAAINSLLSFAVNDFSRFYLKIAKKKILEEGKASARKKIDLINYILHDLVVAISPFMPFTAESIYTGMYADKESVFLCDWPKADKKLVDAGLEEKFDYAMEVISAILNSREKSNMKLRQPLEAAYISLNDDRAYGYLAELSGIIKEFTNVKRLKIEQVSSISEEIRPIFTTLGPEFKADAQIVADELKRADAGAVKRQVAQSGYYTVNTNKGPFIVKPEHFTIIGKVEEEGSVAFKYGKARVDTNISEELREEALVREFERSIQLIRKEMNLKKKDRISVAYDTISPFDMVIKKHEAKIRKNINAERMSQGEEESEAREFIIDGFAVKAWIKRVQKPQYKNEKTD